MRTSSGTTGYCRSYNVDATLPYFLPAPLPLTGTLGAVIRIREPFPSKRALFDIGVAGPIAGFVVLVPFSLWGISAVDGRARSARHRRTSSDFGEPLLFKLIAWLHLRARSRRAIDVVPASDGLRGLVRHARDGAEPAAVRPARRRAHRLRRRSGRASTVDLARHARRHARAARFVSISWMLSTLIMLAMAWFLGLAASARRRRARAARSGTARLVAVFALVIFVLCFTPVPIETFFGK